MNDLSWVNEKISLIDDKIRKQVFCQLFGFSAKLQWLIIVVKKKKPRERKEIPADDLTANWSRDIY